MERAQDPEKKKPNSSSKELTSAIDPGCLIGISIMVGYSDVENYKIFAYKGEDLKALI